MYGRKYRLEIGKPLVKSLSTTTYVVGSNLSQFKDELQVDSKSLVLTDHRISFKVDKSSSDELNKLVITVYNISPTSYGYLLAGRGETLYVRLSVGYGDSEEELKVVSLGSISSIKDIFEGTDRKTTITISDGEFNSKESKVSLGFSTWDSVQIATRLLRSLGLPYGVVIIPEVSRGYPYSFTGNTVVGLKELAEELNCYFSIQNMKVNFLPKTDTDKLVFNSIDSSSGMVGAPTALDNTSGVLSDDKSTAKRGVKFTVLLNPALAPDTLVTLKSRDFDGVFRIQKVKHEGDTHAEAWYTTCEATEVVDNPTLTPFSVSTS